MVYSCDRSDCGGADTDELLRRAWRFVNSWPRQRGPAYGPRSTQLIGSFPILLADAWPRVFVEERHQSECSKPITGINILSLWVSASAQGFAPPIWMTYRPAVQLGAHVRKGERGSLVVYANSITRAETDADRGVEVARDIHFLKGQPEARSYVPKQCRAG